MTNISTSGALESITPAGESAAICQFSWCEHHDQAPDDDGTVFHSTSVDLIPNGRSDFIEVTIEVVEDTTGRESSSPEIMLRGGDVETICDARTARALAGLLNAAAGKLDARKATAAR